jgi:two-component system sensor histidine kinase DesK
MRLSRSTPPTEAAHAGDDWPNGGRPQPLILAVLLAVQVTAILAARMPPSRLSASLEAMTVLAGLEAWQFRQTARSPRWQRPGAVAAEALATYLPLLLVGATWPGMGGFLAASVLVLVPGRAAWALFTAVIASLFTAVMAVGVGVRDAAYVAVASVAIGLTIFCVRGLSAVIRHVQVVQTEVVQLAVVRERMRFARDLHDLLGHSLTAITLRAELTRRIMRTDPAKASDELRDVVDIARQAAAEMRHVADGYRNISLAQEVAAAASLLASADVDARVEMNCGVLPHNVDTVLAMVLRELVTNVTRHSRARNCWIAAEQSDERVGLSVTNDGVALLIPAHRDGGGLENLAKRLEAIGGTLNVTSCGDGLFRVLAEVSTRADADMVARQHSTFA